MMENTDHGSQTFRIPRNFGEFHGGYPTYVHNFVRRYMRRSPIQEQQDRESELISFLVTLPAESKFRRSGASGRPGGCTDRIMTFDPERVHGNAPGLFFGYINRILRNQFPSLEAKKQTNPVTRRGTLGIVDDDSRDDIGPADKVVSTERASTLQQNPSPRLSESPEARVTVSRFLDFVRDLNPTPVLESISSCTAYGEAQADVREDQLFSRARSRLRLLYSCFAEEDQSPSKEKFTVNGKPELPI